MAITDGVVNQWPPGSTARHHLWILIGDCLIVAMNTIVTEPIGKVCHSNARVVMHEFERAPIKSPTSLFKIGKALFPFLWPHGAALSETSTEEHKKQEKPTFNHKKMVLMTKAEQCLLPYPSVKQ